MQQQSENGAPVKQEPRSVDLISYLPIAQPISQPIGQSARSR